MLLRAATKPIVILLLLSQLHARKKSREDWILWRAESEKNVVVSIEIVGNKSKSGEHFLSLLPACCTRNNNHKLQKTLAQHIEGEGS